MDIDDRLARYELRDTQALIDDIAERHPLTEGTTLLALVHQPARAQRLLALQELPTLDQEREWGRDLSDMLYDVVHGLEIPPRAESSASILVTVIVRRGRNGWGPLEKLWAGAWRYSNHNSDAFDRDIIVVTEHGWCSLWSELGGDQPKLTQSAAPTGSRRT